MLILRHKPLKQVIKSGKSLITTIVAPMKKSTLPIIIIITKRPNVLLMLMRRSTMSLRRPDIEEVEDEDNGPISNEESDEVL